MKDHPDLFSNAENSVKCCFQEPLNYAKNYLCTEQIVSKLLHSQSCHGQKLCNLMTSFKEYTVVNTTFKTTILVTNTNTIITGISSHISLHKMYEKHRPYIDIIKIHVIG